MGTIQQHRSSPASIRSMLWAACLLWLFVVPAAAEILPTERNTDRSSESHVRPGIPKNYRYVLRREWAEGVIDPDSGWHALTGKKSGTVGRAMRPNGFVVHCSVTKNLNPELNCDSDSRECIRNQVWAAHVNDSGWSDIGYNYLIGADGTIYEGRRNDYYTDAEVVGAHATDNNDTKLGIALLGDFSNQPPPPKQYAALIALIAAKSMQYSLNLNDKVSWLHVFNKKKTRLIGPRIANHCLLTAKECPGAHLTFTDVLRDVRRALGYPAADTALALFEGHTSPPVVAQAAAATAMLDDSSPFGEVQIDADGALIHFDPAIDLEIVEEPIISMQNKLIFLVTAELESFASIYQNGTANSPVAQVRIGFQKAVSDTHGNAKIVVETRLPLLEGNYRVQRVSDGVLRVQIDPRPFSVVLSEDGRQLEAHFTQMSDVRISRHLISGGNKIIIEIEGALPGFASMALLPTKPTQDIKEARIGYRGAFIDAAGKSRSHMWIVIESLRSQLLPKQYEVSTQTTATGTRLLWQLTTL